MIRRTAVRDVSIRAFRMEDYDDVIALWKKCGLPLKPEGRDERDRIEAQIRLSHVVFLVAEKSSVVVGTVLATHDGRKGWINRLVVTPGFRGQGIGARLVREAERHLEEKEMDVLACLIEEGNDASSRLFGALGYERQTDIHYFVKKKSPRS